MSNDPRVSPKILEFAQAIAKAEGFGVPGAVPTKAHNPGDLVIPGWLGQILGAGISVFETDEEGWGHLYHELGMIFVGSSHVYNLDMTILDMAKKWTMTDQVSWADNVASHLGVSVDTTLREVLSSESNSNTAEA